MRLYCITADEKLKKKKKKEGVFLFIIFIPIFTRNTPMNFSVKEMG